MTIEERLKQSIDLSKNSGVLWSQWSFDKSLLTRSLNIVSSIFPHYSLHEVSHSNSVISEIEKILGNNIEKLSFIDTWLILEASYWHDVGMIITFEEKEKLLNETGFSNFLKQLCLEKNELAVYANIFNESLQGKSKFNFIELEKSFIILLAEYVRREHPDRSKKFFLDPENIGIKSPATGLINSRILLLLADIIECHGKSFDNVLDIPFENDGLDVFDTAHPRFIACLLRIGDLLDLDDGRHCPTLLKTIGNLPPLSLAHLEKHRSIISKNVNEQYIEIISKCESFEAFEVQNDWFSLIQMEISNQDKNWRNIAPKEILWKLPNLKKILCELEGSISIDNQSSRLIFDTNRIYSYISGINLYSTPLSCFDELLQNAMDAIFDRIWLENIDKIKTIDDLNQIIAAHKYRIDVNVSNPEVISDEYMKYTIIITDNGKGMSLDDIKALMTIASEKNRIVKEKYRIGMPDWMKPSGFFGIGLQSIFNVTDQFTIRTNHPNDMCYEITIRKTSGKTPSVIIKNSEITAWDFGTSIIFSIAVPKIPLSVSAKQLPSIKLYQFDPLTDESLNSFEAEVIEIIQDFAEYSRINIYYNNQLCESQLNSSSVPMIVDTDCGLEYDLEFFKDFGRCRWHYRGRKTERDNAFYNVGIAGNIISGSADEYLTLDRKNFHQAGYDKVVQQMMNSIVKNKEEILQKIQNKNEASLYYFLNDKIDNEDWKNIELSGYKINDLINPGTILFIAPDYHEKKDILLDDKTVIKNENSDITTLVNVLNKLHLGIKIIDISAVEYTVDYYLRNHETDVYKIEIMKNKELSFISDEAIKYLAVKGLSDLKSRYWLPCGINQYNEIALNIEQCMNYLWMKCVTHFGGFFPNGIILCSTHLTLDEDINTLVSVIKQEKEQAGIKIQERTIRQSLEEFYKMYKFIIKEDYMTKLLLENSLNNKKEAIIPSKFTVYKDKKGEFGFKLLAANGEVITTGESYPTKEAALKGIASIKKNASLAEIVDETIEKATDKKEAKKPAKAKSEAKIKAVTTGEKKPRGRKPKVE